MSQTLDRFIGAWTTPVGVWYLRAVTMAGFAVVGQSLVANYLNPPPLEWFILAALTLLTGSFTVKVPSQAARLSVSETFVFTSTLLFGPAAGTFTSVLDALVMSFWLKRSTLLRLLFNVSAAAIAIWTAGHTFFFLSGLAPGEVQRPTLGQAVGPLFLFAIAYFLINTWLVAGAVRTERPESVVRIWFHNFAGLSINYLVGGSIAVLLVAYTPKIDITSLGIIIPILLISYITFRTSMGRLEDATKHVTQLNELYLSTVETLAMAVDAKDQITHGHIRRVQVYATELARRLGVKDEQQLRAIEAAALLHDLGKLAIPEHILNKPGTLTPGEFERMKRHSAIGADLLCSIPFPYPVVPIVRHHHENWDGTGYPNGIAGTDIPLGARILSVVDCFDALTSDRPYRPRLSADAAFEILRGRRGSMYDPLVVDTFTNAYNNIAPAVTQAELQATSLGPNTSELMKLDPARTPKQFRTGSPEPAALAEVRRITFSAASTAEALMTICQTVRQLTPATVVALFAYQPHRDVLHCNEALGDTQGFLRGYEIAAGERMSGWVAANQRTITNSAATLDLQHVAERFSPPLKSALATPVNSVYGLMGVLTAYSPSEEPFLAHHSYVVEGLAAVLGECLRLGDARAKSHHPVVSLSELGRSFDVRK